MSYNLDKYLTEAKNRGTFVRFPDVDTADNYELQFEQLIQWDIRINCNPLIVYEHDYKPVAFYDVTTLEGFILNSASAISLEI